MSETKLPCVKCGDRGRALQKLLEAAEDAWNDRNRACVSRACDICPSRTNGCVMYKLKAAVEKVKGGGN